MVEELYGIDVSMKARLLHDGERALARLAETLDIQILARHHDLILRSENVDDVIRAALALDQLQLALVKNQPIHDFFIETWLSQVKESPLEENRGEVLPVVMRNRLGQPVTARSEGQKELIELARQRDVVFAAGPAGTGKTFLAVAMAVAALEKRKVERIALVRPAVEAGENLGFLPGDLKEKIAPYLRPLVDSLQELLPKEKLKFYQESNVIEVAPLAYMRGRTLKKTFVILDEAQNATVSQMKMFLTRLGHHSKAIITGDGTQVDLPSKQISGFEHAIRVLQGVDGVGVCRLQEGDVQRHPLVRRIITAYERDAGEH